MNGTRLPNPIMQKPVLGSIARLAERHALAFAVIGAAILAVAALAPPLTLGLARDAASLTLTDRDLKKWTSLKNCVTPLADANSRRSAADGGYRLSPKCTKPRPEDPDASMGNVKASRDGA